MVNRFVKMECVYRERCRDDWRILYIRLTEKGQKIAKAEHYALRRVIERMADLLDEHEMDLLIGILNKVR
jgi:DNA-binding MarR family transcriptional regulator